MPTGVDHVAIAATDPDSLTRWYCEHLGLEVLFHNGQTPGTYLIGGDTGGMVEIMPDNGADRAVHQPHDPGIRHIAFRVTSLDDTYAALEGKVLGLMPPAPAAGGGRIAFFHDPEGNLVQIVERERGLVGD